MYLKKVSGKYKCEQRGDFTQMFTKQKLNRLVIGIVGEHV